MSTAWKMEDLIDDTDGEVLELQVKPAPGAFPTCVPVDISLHISGKKSPRSMS